MLHNHKINVYQNFTEIVDLLLRSGKDLSQKTYLGRELKKGH